MTEPTGYISLSEAARLAGYSAGYIRRLCALGQLKAIKVGKTWMTTSAALDEYKNASLSLPATLPEIAGTSVSTYTTAQKLLIAGLILIISTTIFLGLVPIDQQLSYLKDTGSSLVTATQDLVNEKVQSWLGGQLSKLGITGKVAGALTQAGEKPPVVINQTKIVQGQVAGVSTSDVLSSLKELLSEPDIRGQLIGPQGPPGPVGAPGIAGPTGYIVGTQPETTDNPGSMGGFTYLSAQELDVDLISATGDTSIGGNLTVAGTITCDSGCVTGPWSRSGTKTYLTNVGDYVGIGTPTPLYPLDVKKIDTSVDTGAKAVSSYLEVSPASDEVSVFGKPHSASTNYAIIPVTSTNDVDTVIGTTNNADFAGSGHVNWIAGSSGFADNYGSGTVDLLWGLYGGAENDSGTAGNVAGITAQAFATGGIVTDLIGLDIDSPHIDAAATVTNRYGIKITAPGGTGTPSGDDYAFYSAAPQKSYFAGSVDIRGGTATEDQIISSSFGSVVRAESGFSGYTNLSGGIGTGGVDSLVPSARLTSDGNLVNIGSIQGGEINLTKAGTFAAEVHYAIGGDTNDIAMADFNHDGKKDLVTANYNTNNVSVLLNNGDGTFAAKVDYPAGTGAFGLDVGDLNGDGKADIVTANGSTNTVSVLLNNGDGTFASKVDYTVGTSPLDVSVADLNGDGKPDIVSANYDSNNISVLMNKGNGTFATKVDYADAGTNPYHTAVADFNGDGRPDIVVGHDGSATISVFMNNGNGTFASKVSYATIAAMQPESVAAADLNGDGKADIVSSDYGTNKISVFINNGNGTFASKVDYTTAGTHVFAVAVGDVNGDGKPDIGAVDIATNTVSVFLNNGNGTFAAKTDYTATTGASIAIGDLNGDGKADIVTGNDTAANISVLLNQKTTLLYAQASTGNVGIGTNAPAYPLDILKTNSANGLSSLNGANIIVNDSGDNNPPTGIFARANNSGNHNDDGYGGSTGGDFESYFSGTISGSTGFSNVGLYGIANSTGTITTSGWTETVGGYFYATGDMGTSGDTHHIAIDVGNITGTADQNIGLQIQGVADGTENYGIVLYGPSAGASNYSIYAAGTAKSYFAGNVGINEPAPSAKLTITGTDGGTDNMFYSGPPVSAFNSNMQSWLTNYNQIAVLNNGNSNNYTALMLADQSNTGGAAGLYTTTDYTNNSDDGQYVDGMVNTVYHSGAGAIGFLRGVSPALINNGSGVVTNTKILDLSLSNSGTITNTYGVYVGDITSGTQTNQAYGIYESDANARNYFAGPVGVGINPASGVKFHIYDAGSQSSLRITTANNSPYAITIDNATWSNGGDPVHAGFSFYQDNNGAGAIDNNSFSALTMDPHDFLTVNNIGQSFTSLTASTEFPTLTVSVPSKSWATGALTTQRDVLITQPTYAFTGASTITDAATLGIAGAPIKSTNATITNTHGLLIQAGAVSTATNSYGLTVNAQTGASANYAAEFLGGNVGIGTSAPNLKLSVLDSQSASNIAAIVNSNSTDSSSDSVLRLGTGTVSTGTSTRFIQFYAGSTADNNGTGVGRIRLNNAAVAYESGAADFAEYFTTSETVSPADVVALSTDGKVKKATNTDPVIGVVSDTAAFVGNIPAEGQEQDKAIVGLTGQMKVKVSEENGQIHAGDRLTVSKQLPGFAAKLIESGQSIGVALQDSQGGSEGLDTILVFVSMGYQHIGVATNATGDQIVQQDLHVSSISSVSGKWSIADDGTITATKLCLGQTCVTEDQLKALLNLISTQTGASTSQTTQTTSTTNSTDTGSTVSGTSTTITTDTPTPADSSTTTPPTDSTTTPSDATTTTTEQHAVVPPLE